MNFTLVRGVGCYDDGTACIISAAVAYHRMQDGEPLGLATDRMACCCPIVRVLLIEINDAYIWDSDKQRTEMLSPFIPRLVSSKGDADLETRRVCAIINFAWANFVKDKLRPDTEFIEVTPDNMVNACDLCNSILEHNPTSDAIYLFRVTIQCAISRYYINATTKLIYFAHFYPKEFQRDKFIELVNILLGMK